MKTPKLLPLPEPMPFVPVPAPGPGSLEPGLVVPETMPWVSMPGLDLSAALIAGFAREPASLSRWSDAPEALDVPPAPAVPDAATFDEAAQAQPFPLDYGF
jgi:hypothetical protein